jgi:tripartite-type tricarboxylate transporter receptor subunit TctC
MAGMAVAVGHDVQAEEFYKGKTIKVVIRSSADGGGNDFYGRLMARHMPKYIPGTPNAIPINMPGASGIVAANYMHNRAKRDGTEIAILARAIAIAQATKLKGVQYDVRNLIPMGSVASDTAVFLVTANSPIKTLKDLKRDGAEIKYATTGASGGAYQRGMVLKQDGYPLRMITGYGSNSEKMLALIRGEVEMTAGSYETVISSVKEEKFRLIGKLGPVSEDMPKGLVDMRDILIPPQRALATLLVAPLEAGRPFYMPPEVPADRVAILRTAFKKAIADPQFLAEAKRAAKTISFTDPEQMRATNREVLAVSPDVMERFRKLGRD